MPRHTGKAWSWFTGARLAAAALALALVAAACTGGGDDANADEDGDTGPPTTLTVGVPDLGSHQWAPHLAASENEITTWMVGEKLTTLGPENEIVGQLAESFELSEDGLTWTFRLRPDIPFHDDWGTLTAEDVKFTWGEYIRPDSEQRQINTLSRAVDGDIENFEVVSDLEFRVHSSDPVVELASVLAMSMPISPKRYYEAEGKAANDHPIGTGPWKFVSSEQGVEVVLEAVEDHWRQTPSFDRLILKEVGDAAARLLQVRSGELDIAQLSHPLIGEAEAANLEIVELPGVINVHMVLGGQFYDPTPHPDTGEPGTAMLDRDAPWIQMDAPEKGRAIREALSLSIDRELILESILFGHGEIAYGPLLQYNFIDDLVDPSWELPEYDLEAAKAKLAEGGYPDGFPIKVAIYESDAPAEVPEAIAGMWEELGLDVERVVTDDDAFGELQDTRQQAGYAYIKDRGYFPEPAASIESSHPERPEANWTDRATTEAYERMSDETDRDARYAIARDLIEYYRQEVRAISLFLLPVAFAVGPNVEGWQPVLGYDVVNNLETATPVD